MTGKQPMRAHSYRCGSYRGGRLGFDQKAECTCGFAQQDKPQAATTPLDITAAAHAWALADRAADDRAAGVTGVERAIAKGPKPVPLEMLAARERATASLREACQAEQAAEEAMRDAARRLLDSTPDPSQPRRS